MALDFAQLTSPLRIDTDGNVRVGPCRVTLVTVLEEFLEGCSCEEIALRYPSVALPDVYAAVTYYFQHRADVDAYLAAERAASEAERLECERRWNPQELRERLLRRNPAAS